MTCYDQKRKLPDRAADQKCDSFPCSFCPQRTPLPSQAQESSRSFSTRWRSVRLEPEQSIEESAHTWWDSFPLPGVSQNCNKIVKPRIMSCSDNLKQNNSCLEASKHGTINTINVVTVLIERRLVQFNHVAQAACMFVEIALAIR